MATVVMAIIGKTKSDILKVLKNERMHGYLLAREADIPVTGIYQHLRELRAEGLIDFERLGRRKIYFLTDRGRKLLDLIDS